MLTKKWQGIHNPKEEVARPGETGTRWMDGQSGINRLTLQALATTCEIVTS